MASNILEEIEGKLSGVYKDLAKYRNSIPEDLSEFEGELRDIEDRCFDILNLLKANEKKTLQIGTENLEAT
jgi:hypothetical protein